VAAHFEVMGHSMVSFAKTPKLIEMPFWMKTRVGPRNHVLDGVQIRKENGQFSGVQAIQKHWQSSLQWSRQHQCGICCKRDISVASNVMQQKGAFRMPGKRQ